MLATYLPLQVPHTAHTLRLKCKWHSRHGLLVWLTAPNCTLHVQRQAEAAACEEIFHACKSFNAHWVQICACEVVLALSGLGRASHGWAGLGTRQLPFWPQLDVVYKQWAATNSTFNNNMPNCSKKTVCFYLWQCRWPSCRGRWYLAVEAHLQV